MDGVPPPDCLPDNDDCTTPACCCGRSDCSFLVHSARLLHEVERDARKAGELGQALLHRHETYVADAEQDRTRMLESIARLEMEKQNLDARNAHMIEENRRLLDQLEALNAAVAESDSTVLSLTECLRSADAQIERLTGLAARTDLLQAQLARFEDEQAALQATLVITKEDERTATLRFQRAERTIASLQDQMDSIEREAREERERHVEVVGRMERRRAVELELQTAAGRLKGAAASKTMDKNGSSVVSHFVKDILQDNANLQLGIVELKEMLDRSNDEVEKLRQIMMQQGVQESPRSPSTPNLGTELGAKELHVHHHYHAPTAAVAEPKAPRREIPRRPKKKRASLTTSHFAPPSGSHTPRSSVSTTHSRNPSTAASAILSQTSVTIPNHRSAQRWSIQSSQTGFTSSSSVPSSPYGESIFDRVFSDNATDVSRPSSPESNGALSPFASGIDHKRLDSVSRLSLDTGMRTLSEGGIPLSQQISQQLPGLGRSSGKGKAKWESTSSEHEPWQTGYHSIIVEENEDHDANQPIDSQTESEDQYNPNQVMRPGLRRAASHESLISVSGMDIHTLQSRPSQLLAGRRMLSSSSSMTSQPVLTGTSAMAIQSSSRLSHSDSRSYLSSIAESQRKPGLGKKGSTGNLAQKVGWVFGRWGYAASPLPPTSTNGAETASLNSNSDRGTIGSSASLKKENGKPSAPFLRPPGINQSGPIFGFGPEPQLPKVVVVKSFDEEALRDSLGDT